MKEENNNEEEEPRWVIDRANSSPIKGATLGRPLADINATRMPERTKEEASDAAEAEIGGILC